MPQAGQQIIKIHILPNISSSKVNQAMKFSQLTKHGESNILLRHVERLDYFIMQKGRLF